MKTEPERAKLIGEALTALYDGICALNAERSPHQEPGSLAEKEQADAHWSQAMANGCSMGTILLESGGEHLTLFVKSITEPVEPLACWTTIRDLLEPCALSIWLFDPTIGHEERARRVFALRYEGMDQELKFVRAAGRPQNELDLAKQYIETLESKANDLGLGLLRGKDGKRTGVGMIMPKSTAVIGAMLKMEPTYRLLSAVAHGHHWAMIHLSYAPAQPQQVINNPVGIKMATIEKHLTIQAIARLAEIAIGAFTTAVVTHFTYVGVDTGPVKALGQQAQQRLAEAVRET